jgi:hypothetical protein
MEVGHGPNWGCSTKGKKKKFKMKLTLSDAKNTVFIHFTAMPHIPTGKSSDQLLLIPAKN